MTNTFNRKMKEYILKEQNKACVCACVCACVLYVWKVTLKTKYYVYTPKSTKACVFVCVYSTYGK